MLVRAIGGKEMVRRSAEAEFGWTEIETLKTSELTQGLPGRFFSFSSHFDEVCQLPSGFRHLARSKDCEIQACQLEQRPVFGIQFHPEKNLAEAETVFRERKVLGTPKRLLQEKNGPKLFDSNLGETIFRNFIGL